VTEQFGVDAYPKALRKLLALRETDSLETYVDEFERAKYGVVVHNPRMGEPFFVTQFVWGLKFEIQNVVQVQVPTTMNRAILLAHMQQEVLDRSKTRSIKSAGMVRQQPYQVRMEEKGVQKPMDLSRERQIRDFCRLNGLCYACGERFEPEHIAKCAKRNQGQLNGLTIEDFQMELTDEVLLQLEQEEEKEEECCRLSIYALFGRDSSDSMSVRSIVNKQVMVMLIDSGSSTSFISEHMVKQLGLTVVPCQPVQVKVASGEKLMSATSVQNLEWWSNGHFYHTDMRVLPLGAFDAILGFDWLKQHNPMECDWEHKKLQFVDEGVQVKLIGDEVQEVTSVPGISVLQVHKWIKGNDVWAFVLLESAAANKEGSQHSDIQLLVEEFSDIFATPTQLLLGFMIITYHWFLELFQSTLNPTGIPHCIRMRLRNMWLHY
jgi:hypothetical protein